MKTYIVFAQWSVGCDDESRGSRSVILSFGEFFERDSWAVEKNILGLEESLTAKGYVDFCSNLATAWLDHIELWRESSSRENEQKKQEEPRGFHLINSLGFFGEELVDDISTINNLNGPLTGRH
jgi:hypothetical protein